MICFQDLAGMVNSVDYRAAQQNMIHADALPKPVIFTLISFSKNVFG